MSKIYLLKKDLPFAKKGTEVFAYPIDVTFPNIYIMGDLVNEGIEKKSKIYLGRSIDLISDGWIEEVKPREFFIDIENPKDTNCYNAIEISSGSVNEFKGWLKVYEATE